MEEKDMKTVVCFGDSNTFGVDPDGGRHPRDARWTGRLQTLLGKDYYIVEEGLNGRTTVFEDPMQPYRNGAEALPYVLQSHKPTDLFLIMLGTNDCKAHFGVSAKAISRGLDRLCRMIEHFDYGDFKTPDIFIVSPIHMADGVLERGVSDFNEDSIRKAEELASFYREIAATYHAGFFDASTVATPGSDALHMDAASHRSLAEALAEEVKRWFDEKTEGGK